MSTKILEEMSKILVPEECLKDFDITGIKENATEWLIELTEKAERVPKGLNGKEAVLDGYSNPIDVLTHAFSLKKIYLRFRRRRWKEKGSTEHYQNQYDLHIAGAKITPELGAFFKEAFG
jgi:hypothetical protein